MRASRLWAISVRSPRQDRNKLDKWPLVQVYIALWRGCQVLLIAERAWPDRLFAIVSCGLQGPSSCVQGAKKGIGVKAVREQSVVILLSMRRGRFDMELNRLEPSAPIDM